MSFLSDVTVTLVTRGSGGRVVKMITRVVEKNKNKYKLGVLAVAILEADRSSTHSLASLKNASSQNAGLRKITSAVHSGVFLQRNEVSNDPEIQKYGTRRCKLQRQRKHFPRN